MLFINAAVETDHAVNSQGDVLSVVSAMKRLDKYMPVGKPRATLPRGMLGTNAHPELILRTACYNMFKPWDKYFDMFMDEARITQFAALCGMAIKKEHTIVQPWPYKIRNCTTKKEFDILRAGSLTGFERYMEFQKFEDVADDMSFEFAGMQL